MSSKPMPCTASVVTLMRPDVLVRQEAFRDQREQVDRRAEQHERDRHRHGVEAQALPQRDVVDTPPGVEHPLGRVVEPAVVLRLGGLRKRLHSIGVRLIDTNPETRIATAIVTANSCSSRPTMPPMKSTGMNTATSDSVIETIVKRDLLRPVERRAHRRLAHLHVPDDVLEHHDRVVDDEADRQDERHQRQVVEAVAEQVHHREGRRRSRRAAPGWG